MSSYELPKKLYLAFQKNWNDCTGYTDNKKIIKQYIKERGDNYYYMEVEKHDIHRVVDFLESGNTLAERLGVYTVNPDTDIRNILTYSEFEMLMDSMSYYSHEIDLAIDALDNMLSFIRLNDMEKAVLKNFFNVIYHTYDETYDHPSDIDLSEEKIVTYAIKHKMV